MCAGSTVGGGWAICVHYIARFLVDNFLLRWSVVG